MLESAEFKALQSHTCRDLLFFVFTDHKLWLEASEFSGISNSARKEENIIGGLTSLRSAGKPTKDGILGTEKTPIHMVAASCGNFKEQLWQTIRTLAVGFILISGVGALIEDKGISKGIAVSS